MPTSHPTISEPSAHLTDPAVLLAAELTAADAALDAMEDAAAEADVAKRCDLESDLLRTKPTTVAGAVALLDAARKVHADHHHVEGKWPDGYEEGTNVAMANVALLLRTATWGQLQPSPAEDEFMARARACDETMDRYNNSLDIDHAEHVRSQEVEDALINAPAPGLRALAWKAQQLAGFTMNAGEEWGVMAAQAIMRDVARLAPEARSPIYGDMYEKATGEAPSASIAPAGSQTDDALFSLIERWRASRVHRDAVQVAAVSAAEKDAAADATFDLFMEIVNFAARTPAGMLAKVRACADEQDINFRDQDEVAENLDEFVLRAVMRDVARLAGEDAPKPATPKRARGSDIATTGYRCHGVLDNPITYGLYDGTWRSATDDELRAELDARPWWCHNVSPATLRRLFPDGDGELVARIVECEEAGREFHAVKLPAPEGEVEPLRLAFSAARDRVAEMEVRTVGGATLLLDWYKSQGPCLTQEQQWRVLWWVGRILSDGFPCEPGEGRCLSVPLVVYPKPENAEPAEAAPLLQAAE